VIIPVRDSYLIFNVRVARLSGIEKVMCQPRHLRPCGLDNFTATQLDIANFLYKSPLQSGYCRTNDGEKGQGSNCDWGQNKHPL